MVQVNEQDYVAVLVIVLDCILHDVEQDQLIVLTVSHDRLRSERLDARHEKVHFHAGHLRNEREHHIFDHRLWILYCR